MFLGAYYKLSKVLYDIVKIKNLFFACRKILLLFEMFECCGDGSEKLKLKIGKAYYILANGRPLARILTVK